MSWGIQLKPNLMFWARIFKNTSIVHLENRHPPTTNNYSRCFISSHKSHNDRRKDRPTWPLRCMYHSRRNNNICSLQKSRSMLAKGSMWKARSQQAYWWCHCYQRLTGSTGSSNMPVFRVLCLS